MNALSLIVCSVVVVGGPRTVLGYKNAEKVYEKITVLPKNVGGVASYAGVLSHNGVVTTVEGYKVMPDIPAYPSSANVRFDAFALRFPAPPLALPTINLSSPLTTIQTPTVQSAWSNNLFAPVDEMVFQTSNNIYNTNNAINANLWNSLVSHQNLMSPFLFANYNPYQGYWGR